jgi:hypothetical protein
MKRIVLAAIVMLAVACHNNGTVTDKTAPSSGAAIDTGSVDRGATAPASPQLYCTLNGKEWEAMAVVGGQLFYANGLAAMYNGQPYLTLTFRAIEAPDNRQLTISFKNFPAKPGVYAKDKIEVLLSGAASGEAQQAETQGHRPPLQTADFSVELTEWKALGANEAIVAGKIKGTLKGLMGAPDTKIANGSFGNVVVKIVNEKH